MDLSKYLPMIAGLLGNLASAGPWGLGAMGVGIAAIVGAGWYLISKNNQRVDARDMKNAGSMTGETSQDMRKQLKWGNEEMERLSSEDQ